MYVIVPNLVAIVSGNLVACQKLVYAKYNTEILKDNYNKTEVFSESFTILTYKLHLVIFDIVGYQTCGLPKTSYVVCLVHSRLFG